MVASVVESNVKVRNNSSRACGRQDWKASACSRWMRRRIQREQAEHGGEPLDALGQRLVARCPQQEVEAQIHYPFSGARQVVE